MPSDFKDLRVWQISQQLMLEIYRVTSVFPATEKFNLADQLRRSALSVPTNIAESHGRYKIAESNHFLINARGSVQEVRSLLTAAYDLKYISLLKLKDLDNKYLGLIKQLNALISIKRKMEIPHV